jgi:hypothetical protein
MVALGDEPRVSCGRGRLALRRPEAEGLLDLLTELIDWRLSEFAQVTQAQPEIDDGAAAFQTGPQLWH